MQQRAGFTFVELAVVITVVGLVVGGILVGHDMVHSAQARAQMTQFEQYQTATNAFEAKYNALPGDMTNTTAIRYGFAARGPYAGMGDGNGLIEGIHCVESGCNGGGLLTAGETAVFWRDLSQAGLISNSFTLASPNTIDVPVTNIDDFWPKAKMELGNYIYAWSTNGLNYFSVSTIAIDPAGTIDTGPATPVWIANYIDTKMDDGLPETGRVLAGYMALWTGGGFQSGAASWAGRGGSFGFPDSFTDSEPDEQNCMNNHGSQSNPMGYSVEIVDGNYNACALSIEFQ